MSNPDAFDEATLRELSVALGQGRRVRFTPGGDPTASLDTGEQMSEATADFLGTKVDEIQELLGRGFEVNVHPDGSVFAFTPDRSQRYLSSPDADLDAMEREFVHLAIRQGATVVIEADGSIAYQTAPDAVAPDEAAATARIAHFDQQVDGGQLATAARTGRQFELAADGTMSYVGDAVTGGGGDAAAPATLQDAFDADVLRDDAAESAQIATRIREVSYDRLSERLSASGLERDERARQAWALQQEAAAADMQVKREIATLDRAHAQMARWEADAQGDDSMAKDSYFHAKGLAAAAQARIDSATARAADLRQQATAAAADVERLEDQISEDHREFDALAEQATLVETRSSLLDSAARMTAAADDADTRAAELRAAGDDAGADALESEAAKQRAGAHEFATSARTVDIDEQRLEALGVDIPDDFEQPLPDGETTPGTDAAPDAGAPDDGDAAPQSTVIDMDPEVIEGTPPTVIDIEPEIVEVDVPEPTPTAGSGGTFHDDISGIDEAEQALDDLTDP